MTHEQARRGIRSYVLRQGRMTAAQERALTELWTRYGLEPSQLPNDMRTHFDFTPELTVLEIGFGMGHALLEMAGKHAHNAYLGIEVHGPGVGQVLMALEKNRMNNVRLVRMDVAQSLQIMPRANFDVVHVLFPDPWPKKRQQKRRLIQPEFVHVLAERIKSNGLLYLATDCQDYAEQMLRVCSGEETLGNLSDRYLTQCLHRPQTKYERRALALGHSIYDLGFRKS